MEAYAAVDGQVRRKMDEMLRTWKEPVPGSLDKRPVFAPEVTQPIESALMKARTSALQAQQGRGRGRPGAPYRETPTPPGVRPGSNHQGPYGQPPPMQQPNGNRPPSAPLPHHPSMAPYAVRQSVRWVSVTHANFTYSPRQHRTALSRLQRPLVPTSPLHKCHTLGSRVLRLV